MNIGALTFQEFKDRAAAFHGYPAPGLLIGGYMLKLARSRMPEGTLFEAVVETPKCLPDAVQLLTPLSTGNGWMRVVNLGRYALSLYDKWTGAGWRVWIDTDKLTAWPEIRSWFLKLKPKAEQDSDRLFQEIEKAGDRICSLAPVQIAERFLGKHSMGRVDICPVCNEAYPVRDGAICRGCQGDAPYHGLDRERLQGEDCPPLTAVNVEEAVGKRALHDMTAVEPGRDKGPAFLKGQEIGAGDLCRLHKMGRMRVYTEDTAPPSLDEGGGWVHEDQAAADFAARMAGPGVEYDPEPREGKVTFKAARDGLLAVDLDRLLAFNLVPEVMCATRQNHSVVEQGKGLAGCRAIPLYLSRAYYSRALASLNGGDGNGGEGHTPLLQVLPLRPLRAGVLATGTEVFQGLIEDRFIPIISSKLEALGASAAFTGLAPDDRETIAGKVTEMLQAGAELIITTAGLSVDPDDVTRHGLVDAGLTEPLYGAPVLPGAMTLVGRMNGPRGEVPVLGVPACALFYKTTSLDLLLPRLLAGVRITRADLAGLGEGGFCLGCKVCTYPKCPFGK